MKLTDKIKTFQHTFHTIGNMTVLPDKRIGDWSINKHRGCHDDWHDYENRFLSALYKVLTDKPDLDEDLLELVRCNDEDFAPFYGEDGENGAFPPTRNGCIHSLSMRERG